MPNASQRRARPAPLTERVVERLTDDEDARSMTHAELAAECRVSVSTVRRARARWRQTVAGELAAWGTRGGSPLAARRRSAVRRRLSERGERLYRDLAAEPDALLRTPRPELARRYQVSPATLYRVIARVRGGVPSTRLSMRRAVDSPAPAAPTLEDVAEARLLRIQHLERRVEALRHRQAHHVAQRLRQLAYWLYAEGGFDETGTPGLPDRFRRDLEDLTAEQSLAVRTWWDERARERFGDDAGDHAGVDQAAIARDAEREEWVLRQLRAEPCPADWMMSRRSP